MHKVKNVTTTDLGVPERSQTIPGKFRIIALSIYWDFSMLRCVQRLDARVEEVFKSMQRARSEPSLDTHDTGDTKIS